MPNVASNTIITMSNSHIAALILWPMMWAFKKYSNLCMPTNHSSDTVFWLDRPLADIMSTDFQTGRPLLTAGREALERLAAERRALYAACAHHRIAEPLLEQAISQIEEIWKGACP